jgi:hypothetical protein
MSAFLSVSDAAVMPHRVRVWYDPLEDIPDRCTMSWGPFNLHLTEAQWEDLKAAGDAGFSTVPSQRRQYVETQAMLGAAKAARKQTTA